MSNEWCHSKTVEHHKQIDRTNIELQTSIMHSIEQMYT